MEIQNNLFDLNHTNKPTKPQPNTHYPPAKENKPNNNNHKEAQHWLLPSLSSLYLAITTTQSFFSHQFQLRSSAVWSSSSYFNTDAVINISSDCFLDKFHRHFFYFHSLCVSLFPTLSSTYVQMYTSSHLLFPCCYQILIALFLQLILQKDSPILSSIFSVGLLLCITIELCYPVSGDKWWVLCLKGQCWDWCC